MNEPENQIFKSEILKKKEHEDDLFFYSNYGEVRRRRGSVLGFPNDS